MILLNLKWHKFILLMLFLSYLIYIPFLPLFFIINPNIGGPSNIINLSISNQLLFLVIIGPLFETFLFQHLVIIFFNKIINNHIIITIISAILFGLSHYYSIFYMFYSFILGILLAYSYIIYFKYKKQSPFITVFIIHLLRNLIAFIFENKNLIFIF